MLNGFPTSSVFYFIRYHYSLRDSAPRVLSETLAVGGRRALNSAVAVPRLRIRIGCRVVRRRLIAASNAHHRSPRRRIGIPCSAASRLAQHPEDAGAAHVKFRHDGVNRLARCLHPANVIGLASCCSCASLIFALALAMPSRCRSSISSRSNSAMEPMRFNISLPVGGACVEIQGQHQ